MKIQRSSRKLKNIEFKKTQERKINARRISKTIKKIRTQNAYSEVRGNYLLESSDAALVVLILAEMPFSTRKRKYWKEECMLNRKEESFFFRERKELFAVNGRMRVIKGQLMTYATPHLP